MSVNVQQIIEDAKNLANKLKESGETANRLINQADAVHLQLEAMKQYSENVAVLNKVAGHRPRETLIEGIQEENRYLKSLQLENSELRAALEEQQNALEFIMSKYRQHVAVLSNNLSLNKVDLEQIFNKCASPSLNPENLISKQSEKIREMRAVMSLVAKIDDDDGLQHIEELSRLATENERLRRLLGISSSSTPTSLHDSD